MPATALFALTTRPLPLHSPMLPRDIPDGPWQEITARGHTKDPFLTHKGKEYLLVCDLFSKYPFLYKVSTKSPQSLCMHLQELQFLQCNHVDHITSSLYFPRSNGFIERQIRPLKARLSTTQESKKTMEDLL